MVKGVAGRPQVNVTNDLPNDYPSITSGGISIHWHGLSLRDHPWCARLMFVAFRPLKHAFAPPIPLIEHPSAGCCTSSTRDLLRCHGMRSLAHLSHIECDPDIIQTSALPGLHAGMTVWRLCTSARSPLDPGFCTASPSPMHPVRRMWTPVVNQVFQTCC